MTKLKFPTKVVVSVGGKKKAEFKIPSKRLTMKEFVELAQRHDPLLLKEGDEMILSVDGKEYKVPIKQDTVVYGFETADKSIRLVGAEVEGNGNRGERN